MQNSSSARAHDKRCGANSGGEVKRFGTWRQIRRAGSRPRLVLAALILTGTLIPVALLTDAYGATHPPRTASAARTLDATDTAHLHYLKSSGSLLLEEGTATGSLRGTVKVQLNVGATVIASFTINTHNGSIVGHASGAVHGTGLYASFGGTMTVTHGTGHYTHAHGHGGFYGVINRHTYALTVQTTGTLSY